MMFFAMPVLRTSQPISVWKQWLQQLNGMAGCMRGNAAKEKLCLLSVWPNVSQPCSRFPLSNLARPCSAEKAFCGWSTQPVSVICVGWCSTGRANDAMMTVGHAAVCSGILQRSVLVRQTLPDVVITDLIADQHGSNGIRQDKPQLAVADLFVGAEGVKDFVDVQ